MIMNEYNPEFEVPNYAKIVRERAAERKEKHKADIIARTIDMYAAIRASIQQEPYKTGRELCTIKEETTISALLTIAASLLQVSDDLTEIAGNIANIEA